MCVIEMMMGREKEEQFHTLFSKLSDHRMDVSESAILCTIKIVLLKMPHARREESYRRCLMHGGKSPVENASCTVGKVLLKMPYARR
jgi:hypothetical protein